MTSLLDDSKVRQALEDRMSAERGGERPMEGGGYAGPTGPDGARSGHLPRRALQLELSESWLAAKPGTEDLVGASKFFFVEGTPFTQGGGSSDITLRRRLVTRALNGHRRGCFRLRAAVAAVLAAMVPGAARHGLGGLPFTGLNLLITGIAGAGLVGSAIALSRISGPEEPGVRRRYG